MISSTFDEYVAAHLPGLLRFAYVLCGDRHLAEDLVQEVLIKAHRRWAAIEAESPDAYLKKAIVRTHISWRRRRLSAELPASDLPAGVDLDAFVDRHASRDELWAMLAGLSPSQRAVLVLRYFEDFDDHRIAELVGISPSTVRVHASRGLNALRFTLAERAQEGPQGQGVAREIKRGVTRAQRRKRLAAGGAAAIIVIMLLAVVITILRPEPPGPLVPVEPSVSVTTLFYSDGKTVLAELDGSTAVTEPVGLVVAQVLSELSTRADSPLRGRSWAEIRGGAYRIVTTIDAEAQRVLEAAADPTVAGSLLDGQPANLQAAGVVVEPGTGRVLAYFGGQDGVGADYAGVFVDEEGNLAGFGAHPPGSSFMVYTLAAALRAGYSVNSRWQWTEHEQLGRGSDNPIRNNATCESDPDGDACSLAESVALSLNVPLYDVTASVGARAVLKLARDAGITGLWADDRSRYDLRDVDPIILAPQYFDVVLGIGQYPVTVLDQANAMATFGAGGQPAQAHFVRQVGQAGTIIYRESLATGEAVLDEGQLGDLAHVLTTASGVDDLAVKTGVWEFAPSPGQNAHAWSIGYSSELGVAIWLGNRAEERPLLDRDGTQIWGAGLPTQILRRVVTETQDGLGLTARAFPTAVLGGNLNPYLSVPE